MWVNDDQVGVHHRRDRKWGMYARLKPLSVEISLSMDVTPRITGNLLINATPYIWDPLYIISMQTWHMVTNST